MDPEISALLLAAGESRRMGQPKLLLPWGGTTVLGKVISTFVAGLGSSGRGWEIVVVTGGARAQVEALVHGMTGDYPLRAVFNPSFAETGMLGSLQAGLRALGETAQAAIIGLGDQPQVRLETITGIITAYAQDSAALVIPSFEQRRGHPWLVDRLLWPEILALPSASTPREFLNRHATDCTYLDADASVLQDLDTPEDYARLQP
jgi:molybdenum cofactor cytidylyltransferase